MTNAGRRFVASRPVNGKGTATTSNALKVTPSRFVLRRAPFRQRLLQRGQLRVNRRTNTLNSNPVVTIQIERQHIALANMGSLSFLCQCRLAVLATAARRDFPALLD